MSSSQGCVSGAVRRWAAAILLGGASLLVDAGCSLIPTWDDVSSATKTVKDTVTGKARQDKLNKTYAEARLLERRKDFAGAESLYRELLKSEPRSRDCYHRLGVIAAQQQKYDDAHGHYKIALECSTPTPDLWSDIGYCFYLQNKMPEAEQALRQALTLQPQHRSALNNLALVVGEQGRIDEAYDLFRRGNNEAEAEQNTGFLCAACGELDLAQQHFSRALTVDPNMKQAAEALIQVTQAMQRREDLRAEQNQIAQQEGRSVQTNQDGRTGLPPGQTQPVDYAGASPGGVVPASGMASNQDGAVQQTSAHLPMPTEPRRLIQVFTGGPRTVSAAQLAARTNAQQAPPTAAPNSPSHMVPAAALPQSTPNSQQPQMSAAPQSIMPQFTPGNSFNFPTMPQPQYLQPMNTAPSQVMAETAQARNAALNGTAPAQQQMPPPASGMYPTMVGGNMAQ